MQQFVSRTLLADVTFNGVLGVISQKIGLFTYGYLFLVSCSVSERCRTDVNNP
jgi:hypothetical protein